MNTEFKRHYVILRTRVNAHMPAVELLEDFQKLRQLAENNSELAKALMLYTQALNQDGRTDEAIRTMANMVWLEDLPSDLHARGLYILAGLYRKNNRLDEALTTAEHAVAMLKPMQPEVLAALYHNAELLVEDLQIQRDGSAWQRLKVWFAHPADLSLGWS